MAPNQIMNQVTGCKIKHFLDWKKVRFQISKYPMYAWSEQITLACRLQYFDIKFSNYELDIEDVKGAVRCIMRLVSYLKNKVQIAFQQGLRTVRTTHRLMQKRMKINDKNLA